MDRMFITIEEDGTITTAADGKISDVNHRTADKFLKDAEKMAGGEVKRSSSKGKVDQSETHIHEHEKANG
jgi:hypothetical protein